MARKNATKIPGSTPSKDTPAPDAPMAPAVSRATDAAEKMSYEDAQKLDREGGLNRRVLTEKGWYVPRAAAEVA